VSDSHHRQLSRIYQRPIEDDDDARAAINADPGVLASALFLEASQSDDVTSMESARSYAEDRLEELGELVGPGAAVIRAAFEDRLESWR
jgi:hypothetical protein